MAGKSPVDNKGHRSNVRCVCVYVCPSLGYFQGPMSDQFIGDHMSNWGQDLELG